MAPRRRRLPHRTYATPVGGPLDGLLLDITRWRPQQAEGVDHDVPLASVDQLAAVEATSADADHGRPP